MLTAHDIAHITGAPLRTVQHRLAREAAKGGPVIRLPRARPGRPPWAMSLDAYCASRCLDRAEVLEVLGREAV